VRLVIPGTGCELAAALLTLELRGIGEPAKFVRGHYRTPDEAEDAHNLHAWVEVADVLLDPTRDQFGDDPFSESYLRQYLRDAGDSPEDVEGHAYRLLAMQWPFKQAAIRQVVELYGLDITRLED
jgi:transglutaminase-like putative cysteine protease